MDALEETTQKPIFMRATNMSLKTRVKNWLTCAVVAAVAAWTVGCAKEASTPAGAGSGASSTSPEYKDKMLKGSQGGSEVKPGADVPEPAPEKEKEATEKTEEKPAETKPNE